MKKLLILLIISISVFAKTNKNTDSDGWKKPEKTWTRPFASSIILSSGISDGDFKLKADFRALILGYNLKTRFAQKKGLAFGLGEAYMSSMGNATYFETTYGTYGFNQFNGRARLGMTSDGEFYTGFSLTKSFTYLISDTSFDFVKKNSKTESLISVGLGFGF